VAGVIHAAPDITAWGESARFGFLAAVVGLGAALYAVLALVGGAVTMDELRAALRRPRASAP
jgi:hypothetical protein